MGIIKQARDQFAANVATFKGTAPSRTQMRKYVAAMKDAADEWLAKCDAQDNAAPNDFAASKQSQFNTFLDALPDPVLGDIDPNL